jgi:hypothetical protein
VENPAGGTNRAGKPGPVDLAADIAEGEVKPHEGRAGAAQDFGGESDVCLEGKAKSMEGSGASAPGKRVTEDREAVKTAWREPRTE